MLVKRGECCVELCVVCRVGLGLGEGALGADGSTG